MESPIIISADWIDTHRDDPAVVLVDVRPPQFFAQAHLTSAVNLPVFFLTDPAGGMPQPAAFAQRLGALGISRETHIVAYDDGASPAAARLYFVLRYLRHPRVSVLDGGITAWRHTGRDWEYTAVAPRPAQYEAPEPDASVLARLGDVRAALGDPDVLLLDVRSPAEYLGLQRTAARNGHLPGALNLDWSNALERDEDGVVHLKADGVLHRLFAEAGITPDRDVIVHCQSGGRSSFVFMVLDELGYPHVRNYDAGWQEWGNRSDTPVEEG